MRDFYVIIEQDSDGWFVGSVPALRGCHTQARSLDELTGRVREAIELCLESSHMEDEVLEFVGIQRVRVG